MNTQYRKNLKSVLEASKSYCDESINNLKWELGTYDLSLDSDTTTAYQKTIPNNTVDCMINSLGGMSYKCNNLWSYGDTGKLSTDTTWHTLDISTNPIKAGTYTMSALVSTTNTSTSGVRIAFRNQNQGAIEAINLAVGNSRTPVTFTLSVDCYYVFVYAQGDTSANSYSSAITDIMLNTGSTALPYQEYFTDIRDSAVSSVVSKDSNDTTLDTLTIDSNIQALTGYGWGINDTCYNYIEYQRPIRNENNEIIGYKDFFIQKVGRVDLGTLTWISQTRGYYASLPLAKKPSLNSDVANIMSANYTTIATQNWGGSTLDKIIGLSTGGNVNLYDSAFVGYTEEQVATALSGVYLYYELATPVETDISQYITTNKITIEAGGTLTFNSTYNQAVPSDIDYLKEVAK